MVNGLKQTGDFISLDQKEYSTISIIRRLISPARLVFPRYTESGSIKKDVRVQF